MQRGYWGLEWRGSAGDLRLSILNTVTLIWGLWGVCWGGSWSGLLGLRGAGVLRCSFVVVWVVGFVPQEAAGRLQWCLGRRVE